MDGVYVRAPAGLHHVVNAYDRERRSERLMQRRDGAVNALQGRCCLPIMSLYSDCAGAVSAKSWSCVASACVALGAK
jgi:hypothetical protein